MDDNPYHAPQTDVHADERMAKLEAASFLRRFFNYFIDFIACYAIGFVLAFAYLLFAGEGALAWMEQPNLLRDYAIGVGLMLIYYIPLEGMFGVTVGKLITGTRVVDEQGRPPSWGQVIGRSVARLIPFEPFSVLFSDSRRPAGWHDRLPKTLVVRTR
ncbi:MULTISPECIES: RDD family protein [Lysobacter]|uniref:RDD family protein n=1 Tax=Lysobacter TaxID=68 RepID=UPI00068EC42B|nr:MULTISPECIES: RDD family protein [Lysobacter]